SGRGRWWGWGRWCCATWRRRRRWWATPPARWFAPLASPVPTPQRSPPRWRARTETEKTDEVSDFRRAAVEALPPRPGQGRLPHPARADQAGPVGPVAPAAPPPRRAGGARRRRPVGPEGRLL